MKKVALHFHAASVIVGNDEMGMLSLLNEEENRILCIPCKAERLGRFSDTYAEERTGAPHLAEVLWRSLDPLTRAAYEIWITDVDNGDYHVKLYNSETFDLFPVDTVEAMLLVKYAGVKVFIDERLMLRQSIPFRGETGTMQVPVNVMSMDMLQTALEDAIKKENYELASYLRDEIMRRKI